MRALKALVIFMGILIIIGMGGLAYGLMVKFGNNDNTKKSTITTNSAITAPNTVSATDNHIFGDVDALLPSGAKIIEYIANGQRLLIIYQDANGFRAIKVINVTNGNDMGIIHLDKINDSEG